MKRRDFIKKSVVAGVGLGSYPYIQAQACGIERLPAHHA